MAGSAPNDGAAARWRIVPHLLLVSAVAVLAWSGWAPADRGTWLAEVFPALIAGPVLVLTYRRLPLTTVTYVTIWLFALVLMVGGHWTYAEVPIGKWAQQAFGFSRNHFDRLGHFLQGVVPALLARELLVRTSPLRPGGWLFFLSLCVALAVSAAYELFEYGFAMAFGGAQSVAFLGSQGDVWDAQNDMLSALIGALVALPLLGRLQQRQIEAFEGERNSET